MFLNTLSISKKIVHTVSKKLENSVTIIPDGRGRQTTQPNKISLEFKKNVCGYNLNNYLVVVHYNIESNLTISKIHT